MTGLKVDVGGRPAKYPWRDLMVGETVRIKADLKLARQASKKFCQRNPEFQFHVFKNIFDLTELIVRRTK